VLSPATVITGSSGGTLAFNRSDSSVFANTITGAVNVAMVGPGTTRLTGANTYTGTTRIDRGTLQVGDGGTAGVLSPATVITGSSGGTLAFNRTDTYGGYFTNTIGGGINLTQSGSGTLWLTGVNTFTGTTRATAGTLEVANALALQNSLLDMAAADAGTVSFNQNSTVGGLTGSRNLDLRGFTLSIGNNAVSSTYSGGLSNGSLVKVGTGTFTLTGTNTYTGATQIDAGTLRIGNAGTTGSLAAGTAITGSSGATLLFSRTDGYGGPFTNTIGGGLNVSVTGTGMLVLAGVNTYTGTTTLSAGTLSISTDANLGDTSAPLVFDGGTLEIAGTSLTSLTGARPTSFVAAKTVNLRVAAANNTFTVSQALNQTTGGLAVTGPGTLVLAGANTFTGTTSVTGGGLRLDYGASDTSKLSNTAALTLTGATVTLEGGSHTEAVGSTTLAAGRTTISRSGGSATLQAGTITRSSGGALDVAESGLLLVNNTNTNGIVGGWLTVAGSDWGVNSTNGVNGPVQAFSGYFLSTSGSLGSTTANTTMGDDTTVGTTTINSLRFAEEAALSLAGDVTLSSGGLLVAPGVGGNTSTITGTIQAPAGVNLVVNQNNTSAPLVIDANVAGTGGVVNVVSDVIDPSILSLR